MVSSTGPAASNARIPARSSSCWDALALVTQPCRRVDDLGLCLEDRHRVAACGCLLRRCRQLLELAGGEVGFGCGLEDSGHGVGRIRSGKLAAAEVGQALTGGRKPG